MGMNNHPTVELEAQIDPSAVTRNIAFHDRLNPALWDESDDSMHLPVRVRLLRAAMAFYDYLEMPDLKLSDIVVTGSNAAYNYTELSDIDVHLIVDYSKTTCPALAENFFAAKKTLWNVSHNITVRGFNIEMYVEDRRAPAYSNGVFSILHGHWLHHPQPTKPAYDDAAVIAKTEHLADEIDALLDGQPDADRLSALMKRLREMRQSGLQAGGEFSTENLAFKSLRALGYLERLRDARTKAQDRGLSL
jgi:hypothetical protein